MQPSLPPIVDQGNDRRPPSLESDTSEHSYHLELHPQRRSAESRRSSRGSRGSGDSPFATQEAQATPIPRDSLDEIRRRAEASRAAEGKPSPPRLDSVDERIPSLPAASASTPQRSLPTPRSRMAAFHDYRQQIGTKSAFSLDIPASDQQALRRGVRVSFDMPPAGGGQQEPSIAQELVGRIVRTRRRLPLPWVIGFGIVSSCALCVGLTTLSIGIYNFTKLRQNRSAKSIQNLEDDLRPMFNNMTASLTAVQAGVEVLLGGRRAGP